MKDFKQKVIGAGAASALAQFTMFVLRLGSLMILARLLTPEDFGLVGMVAAFTGALQLFRDFGLSAASVQRPTITPELISTLFWINLLVGTVLTIVLLTLSPVIAAFYNEPRLQAVTAVLASGFFFTAAGVQHKAILERGMRFATIALIDVASLTFCSAIGIVMALQGYGYWSLLAVAVGIPLVSTICAWMCTGWIPGRPREQPEVRSMLRFGGTATLNGIVVYIAYNLEKVLLGRFWGAEAIGIYGRAYQLVNIPIENMNFAVGGVLFAALSRIQDDPGRFRSYFLKGYSLVLSATIPVAIALGLFAEDIILVMLGPKWIDASPILRCLAPTVLVFALINPLSWLMYSLGLVERSLKISLVLAPLVIAGYLVGLPYGPVGVGIGYSIAMVSWVIPHVFWCVRGTPIAAKDVFQTASRPLLSGLISGLLAAGLLTLDIPLSPLPRLVLSCAVLFGAHFFLIMFVMGEKDVYLNLARDVLRQRGAPK